MTDDPISRQATRTFICDIYRKIGLTDDQMLTLCRGIKGLPPAQPEPKPYRMGYQAGYAAAKRWIPCSERLPEKYGEYRITWTTSASEKRFVADCEYEVYSEWDAVRGGFKGQWLLEDYIKAYPDVHVIAWKPLEEPYRPEGDDKE